MEMGFDVISSDPDISFYRDPSGYFGKLIEQHPNADVFTTTDANNNIVVKGRGPVRAAGCGGRRVQRLAAARLP